MHVRIIVSDCFIHICKLFWVVIIVILLEDGNTNTTLHTLIKSDGSKYLELVCCYKWQKKVPTKKLVRFMNDTRLVLNEHHLGPIWYHSKQFLGWDFFVVSYGKPALE